MHVKAGTAYLFHLHVVCHMPVIIHPSFPKACSSKELRTSGNQSNRQSPSIHMEGPLLPEAMYKRRDPQSSHDTSEWPEHEDEPVSSRSQPFQEEINLSWKYKLNRCPIPSSPIATSLCIKKHDERCKEPSVPRQVFVPHKHIRRVPRVLHGRATKRCLHRLPQWVIIAEEEVLQFQHSSI